MLNKALSCLLLLAAANSTSVEAANGWAEIKVKSLFEKQAVARVPSIRVLVGHDIPSIDLEIRGKYKIVDPNTSEHVSTRFVGKKQLLEPLSTGLKWGEEFPDLHQLKFIPKEPATKFFINGTEYPGTLYIYDIGGTLSIVNELEIEELLKLSLPEQEREEALSQELKAAMVIAARTNLYFDRENPRNKFWNVSAATMGYQGRQKNDQKDLWAKAIDETRYMIMSAAGEKELAPFSVHWQPDLQAKALADQGYHAAQLLSKAFPNMAIRIGYAP